MQVKKDSLLYDKSIDQSLFFFQDLFKAHYHSLTNYAYKIVNDRHAAEDIIQDVFMALWMNKKIININEPLRPYLFKAVHNRSINYLKFKQEEIHLFDKDVRKQLYEEIIQYDNQHDSLLLKEISEEIKNFVETLPPQCKKVFKLSRSSNLRNKEIAEILNISDKTVEAHINKALKSLKEYLIKMGLMCLF